MAVMRHSITFGGVNSADFGLYIGGEGTFNAPKRVVEMISVPGRDGDIAIDQGHFENIEVKYTVINKEDSLSDFSTKLSGFRNAICALRGYQRLEDTFHPNEFRMAIFVDEFEVKPIEYATASEFEITFNCKPFRYLTSGETEQTITDGGTITNPTLFGSKPLVSFLSANNNPSGWFSMGDKRIYVYDGILGNLQVVKMFASYRTGSQGYLFSKSIYNTGNVIKVSNSTFEITLNSSKELENVTATQAQGQATAEIDVSFAGDKVWLTGTLNDLEFTGGTDGTLYASISVDAEATDGTTDSVNVVIRVRYKYTSDLISERSSLEWSCDGLDGASFLYAPLNTQINILSSGASTFSTASALLGRIYIDFEIGEAYAIRGGNYVSLNKFVSIGADLIELPPGDTTIYLDSKISSFKITPRWREL